MAVKHVANDTVLKYGTAAAEPSTVLDNVKSISPNFGDTNLVGTTALGDGTKSVGAGTNEPMSIEFAMLFDPGDSGHDAIVDAKLAKTLISMGVFYPNTGNTETYSDGFITAISTPIEIDGDLVVNCTFSGSGAPTYTQAPA